MRQTMEQIENKYDHARKLERKKHFNIMVYPSIMNQIKQIAKDNDVSLSAYLNDLIANHLEELEENV